MDINQITTYDHNNYAPEHLKDVLNRKGAEAELNAAREFEAVFIQTSLKAMRPKLEEGLFGGGQELEIFYQFFDEEIAKEISKSPNNFGIQDHVLRQHF
jgi:Rod binding domain-containing protein